MAASLRRFIPRINKSSSIATTNHCIQINNVTPSCTFLIQKRWKFKRKIIYKPDGANHVPGIPVHPDRKFPQVDRNDFSEEAEYPPVKPKFPPGSWGTTKRDYAWFWHSIQERATNMQSSSERLNMFLYPKQVNVKRKIIKDMPRKINAVVLDPINEHPASLSFRKYVTKTHMIPSKALDLPFKDGNHESMDSEKFATLLEKVKEALEQHFLLEHEIIQRECVDTSILNNMKCNLLFRCISDTIITFFQKDFEHLQLSQYDEDVNVRAFWHRFGVESEEFKDLMEETAYCNWNAQSLDTLLDTIADMKQTVVSEIVFDAMLRSHLPLPQVEERDGKLSTSPAPQLDYKLSSYGHSHKPNQVLESSCAGHSAYRAYQNPVSDDPCQFGLVGFLSTWETNELETKYNTTVARDTRLAMGITSSFTWLAAQAINQGFSDLIDLHYPLVSQTVLSDGRNFSFLKYQLNTLALWHEDSTNRLVNLCWHTEETPLYDSVENGEVKGLNDEVVRSLVEVFLSRPQALHSDLKPTLANKGEEGLHLKTDFVPNKVEVEEIIEEEQFIIE